MAPSFWKRLGRFTFLSLAISVMIPFGTASACESLTACPIDSPKASQGGSSVQIVVHVPEDLEAPAAVPEDPRTLFLGSTKEVGVDRLMVTAAGLWMLALGAVAFMSTRCARRPLSEMRDRTRRLEALLTV